MFTERSDRRNCVAGAPRALSGSVPSTVLTILDEAYGEFVTRPMPWMPSSAGPVRESRCHSDFSKATVSPPTSRLRHRTGAHRGKNRPFRCSVCDHLADRGRAIAALSDAEVDLIRIVLKSHASLSAAIAAASVGEVIAYGTPERAIFAAVRPLCDGVADS